MEWKVLVVVVVMMMMMIMTTMMKKVVIVAAYLSLVEGHPAWMRLMSILLPVNKDIQTQSE